MLSRMMTRSICTNAMVGELLYITLATSLPNEDHHVLGRL